ncbi:MAG: thiamine-phosphate kinase [Pseudomonadota bacterium]
MDEFATIERIVDVLGPHSTGPWVNVGPGDDAALIQARPDHELVASIDTLVADVHFPAEVPADLIGYRALMVALSDLAAMAAQPRYVLVALTCDAIDGDWIGDLAAGMAAAAARVEVPLCGGNLARGPLSISVSVHGDVPVGQAVLRSGAKVGEYVYVTGALGGAAACVRERDFAPREELTALQTAYYRPLARFDCGGDLRDVATAAIDISDGLVGDLTHIAGASGVGLALSARDIPVAPGAQLDDALYGGDDYELAFTSPLALPNYPCIGTVAVGAGVLIDGQPAQRSGFRHFHDQ